jgi:hypothetical protein
MPLRELLDAELGEGGARTRGQLRDALLLVDEPLEARRDVRAARLHAVHPLEDGDGLGHEAVGGELVREAEQHRDRFFDPPRLHQEVGELEPDTHRGRQPALELTPQRLDGLAPLPLRDQLADVGVERRVEPVQGHRDLGPRRLAGRKGYVPEG